VWLAVVAALLAVPASSTGKTRVRKTIKAEVDEAVLRFEKTGFYLACGCGCCGDKRGARTVCLSAETGSLREVVEGDRHRARSRHCAAVGCALGIRFVTCADATKPLRRSRKENPKIVAACKERSCTRVLALKDGAGMIGAYVIESSIADVPTLYVDSDGNLLGSLRVDVADDEKQAAAAVMQRLRKELPSEQQLCCEGGS
jgi:hypothetical protein